MTTTEAPPDQATDKIDEVSHRPDPDLKLEEGQKLSSRDKSALNVLVRMHFKTLLDEITDEEQRALAEVNVRIANERRKQSTEADGFKTALERVMALAQARVDDLVTEHANLFGPGGHWQRPSRISSLNVYPRNNLDEGAVRNSMISQIRSRATTARLHVRRRETENLRAIQLAVLSAKLVETVRDLPQREAIFKTEDLLQLDAAPIPVAE